MFKKQENEILKNRVLKSNEWDRDKLYTDFVSSNKNPLKDYGQNVGYLKGDANADVIKLDRSHSLSDLRILG